jgi:hypothetical protein
MRLFTVLALSCALTGCTVLPGPFHFSPNNTTPVARAEAAPDVALGEPLQLDGSRSYDPDEDELRYEWEVDELPYASELPANPFTVNGSRNAGITEVLLDVPGIYVFSLRVVDPDDATSHHVYITVLAVPDTSVPVADAGPDAAGIESQEVCVDGSNSQDPRGRELTYSWTVAVSPSQSEAGALLDGDQALACLAPDVPGEYLLSLVVDAGARSSAPDFVTVLVHSTNQTPTALPGFVEGGSCATVHLDGTASTDPDGDDLQYRWDLLLTPFGSRTPLGEDAFSDSTSPTPVFYADVEGEYLAQLVVDDGENHSTPVALPLALTPKETNTAPTVGHSEDVYVRALPAACWLSCAPTSVPLDAFGTSDPDGDPVDITWEVLSGDATLDTYEGDVVDLEIAPPSPGCVSPAPRNLVEIRVTATDCSGASTSSTIVVAYDCG